MKLTITARELRELVAPVLPLAGAEHDLPVLAAVLIEKRGPWITATATDRYRLGVSRIKAHEGQGEFIALLSTADVKRILALFRPSKAIDPELTLTASDDGVQRKCTVEASGGLMGMLSAQVTFSRVDGEYPKVSALVAKQLKHESDLSGTALLSASFLADFKVAVRGVEPLRISASAIPGQVKPTTIIRCGDHFLGLLMPVMSNKDEAHAPWDDVFPAHAEEKAEAAA